MRTHTSTWLRVLWLTFAATALFTFTWVREAGAVPSFARKYQTSCTTCHTVYPMLNPFGEAFRRNGYRFPAQGGANDTDATRATILALGQEEYKKRMPDAIWPASIAQEIPFGVMFNGRVNFNIPGGDANPQKDCPTTGLPTSACNTPGSPPVGNTFTWSGIHSEFHLFGAGSINENLTYMTQVTMAGSGLDLETGYLLWNDIVGPSHAVNLWIGRLFKPSLDSFGLHSSYLSDTRTPGVAVSGLFNPNGSLVLGQGHSDGIEINGILMHRIDYSIGWLASGAVSSLGFTPNASDLYAHLGFKLGGMSLDGEGAGGASVPDANKPWAETSLTLDIFGWTGKQYYDNGTGIVAVGATTPAITMQENSFQAAGASMHLALGSLLVTSGVQYEVHGAPFMGKPYTPADPSGTPAAQPGTPDTAHGKAIVQYNEIAYVVWPWLVPAIRTEYTWLKHGDDGGAPQLFRIVPGVATNIRPNIRAVLTGSFETVQGTPFSQADPSTGGGWGAAGASIVNPYGVSTKMRAETITLTVNVAY